MADGPNAPQRPLPRGRPGRSWPRSARHAALAALLAAPIAWFVVRGVLPNTHPRNFGTVQEGVLYRSASLPPAALRDTVQRHAIRTVIDLGTYERGTPDHRRLVRSARALGVEYRRLPLFPDATGDPNRYAQALRIINDPASRPVLVTCAGGSEATGALVSLYRHHVQGIPLEQAYAQCADHAHRPDRNPQLWEVLQTWSDDIAHALQTGDRITYTGPSAR